MSLESIKNKYLSLGLTIIQSPVFPPSFGSVAFAPIRVLAVTVCSRNTSNNITIVAVQVWDDVGKKKENLGMVRCGGW
jgi:hypothetical protein